MRVHTLILLLLVLIIACSEAFQCHLGKRDLWGRPRLSSQSSALASATTPAVATSLNPLWPSGVSDVDVEVLVKEILADPSINVPGIPDLIERHVYRTTTLLTYNAVYQAMAEIHGHQLWGHTFSVSRARLDEDMLQSTRQQSLTHMKTDVDEELLEQVATQLLANTAINQPLIPDVLEKQLFVNCLKIIFRILNMLAASVRITVCGHDLTLNLEKAVDRRTIMEAARTAKFSETPIDTSILQDMARLELDALQLDDNDNKESNNQLATWWKQGVQGTQREFTVQINAVLYSLVLGILDDLLANTELVIMTDRIHFDILPPGSELLLHKKKGRHKLNSKNKQR